jgi:multiple sugar transport system substrate-binding protein
MAILTRRSVLRASLALGAAAALPRPHVANAAATTIETWWVQGFAEEEDIAFKKMVADYEKASGDKIEHSIIPYAALRGKAVTAITSGVVPDIIEVADFALAPIQAWNDRLVDLSDVVEPVKSQFTPTALQCCYHYNNTTKKRAYYVAPTKIGAVPFHIWKSLVEKGGSKVSDIPKTWDAFLDFFKPVQDGLRKQGMRNVYAYGYQLTTTGVDPIVTFRSPGPMAGPRLRRRQAPKRRSQGAGGGDQGNRQDDDAVQGRLRAAGGRQLERCRRQQRLPLEADGDGFRRDDFDRGRAL